MRQHKPKTSGIGATEEIVETTLVAIGRLRNSNEWRVLHESAVPHHALERYTERLAGVVSPSFHKKTIAVVGLGAGSYMVEKLARLVPGCLRLCDFDLVEMPNLSRTCYTVSDALIRRPKAVALAHRIGDIAPVVEVVPFVRDITGMDANELNALFDGVDLVIAGTDRLEAQALINEQAMQRGIPAVFIGLHAGAQGGRIIWVIPGQTPCYRCVARERFMANSEGEVDLQAARGALIDCQFVDMVAAKVAVAILERGEDSAMGRFFDYMGSRSDIVARCDPAYAWGGQMWDALLADLPREPKDYAKELRETGLFAMDTIWFTAEHDPHCPLCRPRPRQHDEVIRVDERLPEVRIGQHPEHLTAPFDLCITQRALRQLLRTVGLRRPESGAKAFGPADRMGIDLVEFDRLGSAAAGGAVYSPDVDWGRERVNHHLAQPDERMRLWTGDIHSHPGGVGVPSSKAGPALGDLGYVEEVFQQNESMEFFLIPILTETGPASREVTIHPWIVRRDGELMIARLRVCDAADFPEREFNPKWQERIEG